MILSSVHLKGAANTVGKAAPFATKVGLFAMGTGDGTKTQEGRLNHGGYWRDEKEWPLARTRPTPFYLQPGGKLATTGPTARSASTSFVFDPRGVDYEPLCLAVDGNFGWLAWCFAAGGCRKKVRKSCRPVLRSAGLQPHSAKSKLAGKPLKGIEPRLRSVGRRPRLWRVCVVGFVRHFAGFGQRQTMKATLTPAVAQRETASSKQVKLLTKSELADAVDQLIRVAVTEKEFAAASAAFMRTEVLELLRRKITKKFALKACAKRHRQLASEIENDLKGHKDDASSRSCIATGGRMLGASSARPSGRTGASRPTGQRCAASPACRLSVMPGCADSCWCARSTRPTPGRRPAMVANTSSAGGRSAGTSTE